MYYYVKALHIIFIVTWFSGLFYMVRLFIYNTEAGEKDEIHRDILRLQYTVMIKRLWFGITWPSAVLTFLFGVWILVLYGSIPAWLWIKLLLVAGLFLYHISLQIIFKQQMKSVFKYTSQQLRIWNEVATVFLIAIVMLVVVKQGISLLWGLTGLILFVIVLMTAIRIYKRMRR
ncbi:MAG: CopD family protein [Chitinophagaceae bacterium]